MCAFWLRVLGREPQRRLDGETAARTPVSLLPFLVVAPLTFTLQECIERLFNASASTMSPAATGGLSGSVPTIKQSALPMMPTSGAMPAAVAMVPLGDATGQGMSIQARTSAPATFEVFNGTSQQLVSPNVKTSYLNLIYWVVGQGFGGLATGSATDVNSGPLFVLLARALFTTLLHAPALVRDARGAGAPLTRRSARRRRPRRPACGTARPLLTIK